GYIYLLHRYYDPTTATFTTTDPLVSISGSPYGYVGGDPLNTTDPTGLFPPLVAAFIGGALLGGGIELGRQIGNNLASGCGPLTNINWGNVAAAGLVSGTTTALLGGLGSGILKAANAADNVLPAPQVSSARLQNLVKDLYKGTANPNRVGNGTTMDALRNEILMGAPTGGRFHLTKGRDALRGLKNWLRRNPEASHHDRLVAQSLADELSSILGHVR
ncbi:MAG: RHS repeat-associated core domain-containing protein, partial [Dermatophilaceae bacterium]